MEKTVNNEGFKIECAGCLAKTKIGEIKKIGKKYYCPNCQSFILTSLSGGKELEKIEEATEN